MVARELLLLLYHYPYLFDFDVTNLSFESSFVYFFFKIHLLIRAVEVVTNRRKRKNFDSKNGIDPKFLTKLFEGFFAKIEHDPYSQSTYQLAKTIMHTFTEKKIKSFTSEQLNTIRKVSESEQIINLKSINRGP